MSTKDFKVVLGGDFGSGRTSFATRFLDAKKNKKTLKAIKTDSYPLILQTSAGAATFTFFDTLVHAKGGLPDNSFFRTSDAAILFFDTTNETSYENLVKWYDAVDVANGRKGSEPLPVIIVGTKVDDIKARDVKVKDIEFPRKKGLTYVEISAKANYNVKELLLEVVKALLGFGTILTDEVALEKASLEVDADALEKLKKEYEEAGQ
ncbi:P-loop containing nucleoside triphosphate hydrolase protein [Mrakia frigida]|uniref:P-loop containing nucleoside triphosphate hydrolase protein n=1 Tax=Mrakia frigida TaxID=29902 RepID=UPI003FCC0190